MTIDVAAILREVGAMQEGHFLLSSGRHADRYIEKFALLMRPRETEQVCRMIAEHYADAAIDTVAGPTTGGILLAFEIARQLGIRAVYAERATNGPEREFRRGATFRTGERVLVIDDIMTTGGAIRETLAALAPYAVETIGVAVLVDRSGGRVDLGLPLFATLQTDIATFAPDDCPLCREGLPLVKPGTTVAPGGQTAT
ncbi:MAG TPA: orotate phosphoribosyltransferase [Thermomicrobiales bacterium]|jgi:orotate phosphoribosyltransferase